MRSDNYALIIPARYESSRFPGKPLVDIRGKSLVQRVWESCVAACSRERVIVATDDERIRVHCQRFGADVQITSKDCATGTDRVAQVVEQRGLSWAINVQGDEPFVRPEDIQAVKSYFESFGGHFVVNAMAPISDQVEWSSLGVPKVVCGTDRNLLYISRAPIPGNKSAKFKSAWKQVCIYAFSAQHLTEFVSSGRRTPLEAEEDIEILRFIELSIPVKMLPVTSGTIAIDFPEDVRRAEALIDSRGEL